MKRFMKNHSDEISETGNRLLQIEWDFKAAREEFEREAATQSFYSRNASDGGWLLDLAEAFRDTMTAANSIGWMEHTCDWDPYLIITMADGRVLNTPSHYYLVVDIEVSIEGYSLLIEAPDESTIQGYEEATTNIHEYYIPEDHKGRSVYRIPLMEIDYITVDPQ